MAFAAPHLRRPMMLVAVVALLAVVGGAVAFFKLSDNPSAPAGPTTLYTEGVAGTWQRVNPLFADTNAVDEDLASLVFNGLVRIGPDGTVQPGLANLPTISPNGRVYTFKLRDGLRWQDGPPVTSKDVLFTINQLTDSNFQGDSALAAGWIGVKVAAPNPSTVVVTLKQPSAPFLARNATIGILPYHLLGKMTPTQLYDAPFNAAPIGTGPYRIQSIDSQQAILVANDDYFLGKPAIQRIDIRFYPDYSSALVALNSGLLDGLMLQGSITPSQVAQVRQLKNVTVHQLQGGDYLILYLNNDQSLFSDSRVRRAISLALNRRMLVDGVYAGVATPSSSPITPDTWAYDKKYDITAPDISKANQLLAEAGWKIDPSTGILVRNGQEFRFTIRVDNDPTRVAAARTVASQLAPLGIRATVASTTFAVLRRDFLQSRNYEAAIAIWAQGPDPDPYSGWHSSQMGSAGLDLANFSNSVADELISTARTSDKQTVRKGLYAQFQQVWQQLMPGVVLAYPDYLYAQRTAIRGARFGVLFDPSLRFSNIQDWHE